MTAPTPAELAADIKDIIDTLSHGVTVGEGAPVSRGGTFHKQSLDVAYRWLHGAAYAARAGGEATSVLCAKCGGRGWVAPRCWDGRPEHDFKGEPRCPACGFWGLRPWGVANPAAMGWLRCEACTPRATSDPTGEVVAGRADMLRVLDEEVGKRIRRALDEVTGAVNAVQRIVEIIDRGADRTLPNERHMPRTVDSGELRRAKEAQARRTERGEGVA